REVACDDAALRAGADAADYAGHLLALARTLRRPHPALAAMAARPALETRIVSILTPGRDRGPASRTSTLSTAIAGMVLAVGVAALEPVARLAPAAPARVAMQPLRQPAPPHDSAPVPRALNRVTQAAAPLPVASLPPTPPAERMTIERTVPPVPTPRTDAPVEVADVSVPSDERAPLFRPLAFKTVDPDAIMRQVAQLRATVAALHDLDPEALSTETVGEALAAVPDLSAEDRAVLHAEALADLSSATAAAERRLWEAETAFERDIHGGRGARGPSL
ncbi:MAG TPA: hypothetical protein VF594_05190, partial [Rubricoccaceae bacterium]